MAIPEADPGIYEGGRPSRSLNSSVPLPYFLPFPLFLPVPSPLEVGPVNQLEGLRSAVSSQRDPG